MGGGGVGVPKALLQLMVLLICSSSRLYASANKYCAFEIDGEAKYYICPRNENCCSIGCCVNLAFHFYQLWYYWLLVIFLFMLCSGGGWWFRFCRSGHATRTPTPGTSTTRYSPNSHAHPSTGITSHSLHASSTSNLRASSRSPYPYHQHLHHHHQHHSERSCPHHRHQVLLGGGSNGHPQQQQRARILHRPAATTTCGQRNSMYYLQRIWKGPPTTASQQQQPLPPSYSTMFFNILTNSNGTGGANGETGNSSPAVGGQLPSMSARPPTNNCPYYQLYGPPPSYDSVIQLTSEGVTTSCCLVEPEQQQQQQQGHVQVNRNEVAEEGAIEEIVISAGEGGEEDEVDEPRQFEEVCPEGADVSPGEMPLISVKCNNAATQLEGFNAATCEEEQVVSGSILGEMNSSSESSATSTAQRKRQEELGDVIPSTSSS